MAAQHPIPVPVRKSVNRLSKAWELFSGKFKPLRHGVGMEWIADFNPVTMTSAPSAFIIRAMNPEIRQILDELGMTLLTADLIQVLHQSTPRFTNLHVSL